MFMQSKDQYGKTNTPFRYNKSSMFQQKFDQQNEKI